MLATLDETSLHGKGACMCIAVACVSATYSPSHAWAANDFGNETKRAIGMGLYRHREPRFHRWIMVLPITVLRRPANRPDAQLLESATVV